MALFICQGCGAELASWEGKCPQCGVSETIRLSPASDRMVDKVVKGKWKIIRKLGQGGMGAVYLAEQVGIGHRVALKFLKSEFSSDAEIARRFLNEAKSYARVSHPNAVTLHDFGQDDEGNLYIAMEYCEGVDLKKVIAEQARLPMIEAVEVVLQVADVLATAHSKGVIHRDLKPENIMIRRGMRGVHAKVLDFGIARLMGEGTRLTMAGAIAGTPRYMSPEQVEGREVDLRADIYSLGIVLFELLTGKQPFDGATIAEILRKQVAQPMPHLAEVEPTLDYPEIDAVIQKACAKRRDERWPDLLTFASALSQAVPTQAHLSVPPLQRTGLLSSAGQATPQPGQVTGQLTTPGIVPQATPEPGTPTAQGSPPWTLQDATGQTVVRQPTLQPLELQPKSGGGTQLVSPPTPPAPSRAPFVVLALVVLLGGGAAAWFFLGPKGGGTDRPIDKPVADRGQGGQGGQVVANPGQGGSGPPPAQGGGNGQDTAAGALDEARHKFHEDTARDQLGKAKTELELAKLDEAETYLKGIEPDTQAAAEAKALLAQIGTIREKLKSANRLRGAGQCDQALPLYQEVLKLNAKNSDAKNGLTWCREGTVSGTME